MFPLYGSHLRPTFGDGQRLYWDFNANQTYAEKVLTYSPYAYWPLWEASGTDAEDLSGNGFTGTYANVTLGEEGIGDGRTCPLFDGSTSLVDIYSDAFRDSFPYDEGSFVGWMKVFNAGVWTDGARRVIFGLARDFGGANYFLELVKLTDNNYLRYLRAEGAGTNEQESVGLQSFTAWAHFALTWSVISGNLKCYIAASQIGATQSPVLAAQNQFIDGRTCIGARNTTPTNVFHGWLAHPAVFPSVLDDASILDQATL